MIRNTVTLSEEQRTFIQHATAGENILVNACIGSGKTTTIQCLCNLFPANINILYLTYNKLLKIDAKRKIKRRNVTVTNYHGFAYSVLLRCGIRSGQTDIIQIFNQQKPPIEPYDVLIIDEYQDIDQEISEMLAYIKEQNPSIQILAVGDMDQKIYNKTTLNIAKWIDQLLGTHIKMRFTRCFRLSNPLSQSLGRIWHKPIVGVNKNCRIQSMDVKEVTRFLAKQNPGDILCLGSRTGSMIKTLNVLEEEYPYKFNKQTVYATISDNDSARTVTPNQSTAIFTTYDGSKGLERKICVVFDFTEEYWAMRAKKPQQSQSILRNVFCVAASRGKEYIIFVQDGYRPLSEETLLEIEEPAPKFDQEVGISTMFDFKYKENIEECYHALAIKRMMRADTSIIEIKTHDALIDLSPCVGIYQEAMYFHEYNIDKDIAQFFELNQDKKFRYNRAVENWNLEEKILYLVALETDQNRYVNQVNVPYVQAEERQQLIDRLDTMFTPDEMVQVFCTLPFATHKNGNTLFTATGYADVVKDNTVFELKFVSELTHEHFLQCACYMVALGLPKGVLWNTRNNHIYEIQIPDRKRFMDLVIKAFTKQVHSRYFAPKDAALSAEEKTVTKKITDIPQEEQTLEKSKRKRKSETHPVEHMVGTQSVTSVYSPQIPNAQQIISARNIALIDVETTWSDKVMSVGVLVVSEDLSTVLLSKYYLLTPEYQEPSLYEEALYLTPKDVTTICSRQEMVAELKTTLKLLQVKMLFAYNASFDHRYLPELAAFSWYDIMKVAAYKQYNKKLPHNLAYHKTGRLKSGYGVEPMLQLLSHNPSYREKHNALLDCFDELRIMQLLGKSIMEYQHAKLP